MGLGLRDTDGLEKLESTQRLLELVFMRLVDNEKNKEYLIEIIFMFGPYCIRGSIIRLFYSVGLELNHQIISPPAIFLSVSSQRVTKKTV